MSFQRIALPAIVAFAALLPLGAQQTGTIEGILVNPAGARIPDAKLVAIDQSRQLVAREGIANADGTSCLRIFCPAPTQ